MQCMHQLANGTRRANLIKTSVSCFFDFSILHHSIEHQNWIGNCSKNIDCLVSASHVPKPRSWSKTSVNDISISVVSVI